MIERSWSSRLWDDPHAALAPIFWAVFRARTQAQREWCYPPGASVVRIAGASPIRILLIGDGPAAGYNVHRHELGLAGCIARRVATRTHRGVVVAVSAEPTASARSTRRRLASADLTGFDAIVLVLATTDALCLTPRRSWRRDMGDLVQALVSTGATSVIVTGTASMGLSRSLGRVARGLVGRHADMLTFETHRICERMGVPMMPLDATSDITSRTYARWGHRLGGHIAQVLRGDATGLRGGRP